MRKELQNTFNRKFYTVEYREDLDIIDTLWYGYASASDLKKACEIGLEVLEATHCPFKLNDNTQLSGPWSESVKWLEHEWLPKAMQAGVRFLAHVAMPDSFGEEAGEVMRISKIGQELQYKVFSSREDALVWLKACQYDYKVVMGRID
ncbi:hypothetical protein [Pontibacter sp. SGAir0037]|uniref:hypothetical protein n=1 Tax=Pontibacter sp. SGAir0037 TaxID=2571030 RepID=UPI0010CCC293|nr:hypothetical protein [Pontibacter sp. SGAir0037]QCR23698.1 hypothetical protein C1N53_15995 [Pontibacter sp. SGAir0037]